VTVFDDGLMPGRLGTRPFDAEGVPSKVTLATGANEAVVRGNKWQTLFDGHQHPTGTGPSGPPTPGVPIPSATCLSTKVTTE